MSSPPPTSPGDPSPAPENPPPPPVIRKFPAPCWTQDETLALIHAYQDKWYSLRRRNLRTADWEAVADEVNRRCPNQSPPKSSAQCRHKMEKLRKRYRAEKQRISALPAHNNFVGNRFFPSSSWVFFDLMDSMEIGPGSVPGSGPGQVSTAIVNVNNNGGVTSSSNHNHNSILSLQNPSRENGSFVKDEKTRGKDDLGKYFDEILMGMGKSGGGSGAPIKFRVKNHSEQQRYFEDTNKFDGYEGFDVNNNVNNGRFNKRKLGGEMFLNGGGSSKKGSGSRPGGRGRDEVAGEMVSSIKMLGEALVRTEKEKMEMMQEMEMKWMEMEMKRTQMILEAQHSIVNAFVQGFKKQKEG